MVPKETGKWGKRRPAKPLNQASLEELALSYAARFATSSTKLAAYLQRKIRERGVDDDAGQIDPQAVVERLVELKYVDDEAYARARAGGLLRRGYGGRRIDQSLRAAGIADELLEEISPHEAEARRAALTMARKRGFGPFGVQPLERDKREKQIAAMLRAGHGFDAVREVIDAQSVEQAEQWLAEAEEEAE